jgi:hypothetical protein
MRYAPLLLLSLLLPLVACTDDPAPRVTVISATPDHLDPADDAADDVSIRVEYEDADGDLGGGMAEVHDCRDPVLVTKLPIPAIASDERVGSHISGSLDLFVTDVGAASTASVAATCADLGVATLAAGTTAFCVVLTDAADHAGPGDCTAAITIAP